MKSMQTSCVIAACLGLLACGDASTSAGDLSNASAGQNAGSAGNGDNGGAATGVKDGDPVDLDGDGQKDDGVAVDEDGDGKVDGVDTNGDGKVDAALPGDSMSSNTGGNGSSATAGSGTSAGEDAAVDEPLSCDGVGICDDNFKDTCDGNPDSCPTTQSSGIDEPAWDCSGEPPSNVYAYAKFPDGTTVAAANLAPGACVAFFEGAKGLYYAKWFKFGPADSTSSSCMAYEGCICPKGTFANQSFDRRLYAFTWNGEANCDAISIVDHKENSAEVTLNQPVSNDCRKYLYALHTAGDNGFYAPRDGQGAYDLPFSFVAGSLPALKLRLKDFPKVEVACVDVQTAGALPWAQLMASDVKTNAAFAQK